MATAKKIFYLQKNVYFDWGVVKAWQEVEEWTKLYKECEWTKWLLAQTPPKATGQQYKNEIDNLRKEVIKYKNIAQSASEKKSILETELEKVKDENDELSNKNKKLLKKVWEYEADNKKLVEMIEKLQKEVEEKDKELEKLQKESWDNKKDNKSS